MYWVLVLTVCFLRPDQTPDYASCDHYQLPRHYEFAFQCWKDTEDSKLISVANVAATTWGQMNGHAGATTRLGCVMPARES